MAERKNKKDEEKIKEWERGHKIAKKIQRKQIIIFCIIVIIFFKRIK